MDKLPDHLREFDDHAATRKSIYDGALAALEKKFPLSDGKTRLELHDTHYTGKQDFSYKDQKKALMEGNSLRSSIKGTWKLYDEESNELLDEKTATVMRVPYYTDRGTIVNSGNDYAFVNQARLKPGVFTRTRTSGEHEAQFNVKQGTGKGFRTWLEPSTGIFRVNVGQSNIPAYQFFKTMGVTDKDMIKTWGQDLWETNKAKLNKRHLDQTYKQFAGYGYKAEDSDEDKAAKLKDIVSKSEIDPWIAEHNLGLKNTSTITPAVLLRSSQKLLNINRGDEEQDDRDNPYSTNVLSVDDFIKERIDLDAGQAIRSLHNRASFKRNLNHVGPDALRGHIDSLVLNSGLASPLEETNPMHIMEQVNRLTKLGDGGLPSSEAVTDDARAVNPGQAGFIDMIAGPECYAVDTQLLTEEGWLPVQDITADTLIYTRSEEYLKPIKVFKEKYDGPMVGILNDDVDLLITPNHRHVLHEGQDLYAEQAFCLAIELTTGLELNSRAPVYVSPEDHYVDENEGYVYCVSVPGREVYTKRSKAPVWSGNSDKIGIDTRLAYKTYKGNDKQMYSEFLDKSGKTQYLKPEDLAGAILAFPAQTGKKVYAIKDGKTIKVPRSEVDYTIPSEAHMNTAGINVVPMNNGYMASRAFYSAKYQSQFLPLVDGEAPLVTSKLPGSDQSFSEYYGRKVGALNANNDGVVSNVTDEHIEITAADGTKHLQELAKDHSYNRMTSISHKPLAKIGQQVKKGDLIAHSNFTDSTGALNMGRNLRIATIPQRDSNTFEDLYTISESAAKKLSSERLYGYDREQNKDTKVNRNKYISQFPKEYTKSQLENIDDKGVVKPGTVLNYGDPMILATGPKVLSSEDAALGNLHKVLRHSVKDESVKWEHHTPGIVTDVALTSKGAAVNVKTSGPVKVGDKLVNGFSSKGVVGAIKPDDEMLKNKATGKPYEVIFNPMAVQSRVAPNQIVEQKLGKIAAATGQRYNLDIEAPEEGWDHFAKQELARHGLNDKEDLVDPKTGKTIKQVGDGVGYMQVFHHLAEKKLSTRGVGQGGYDQNEQPGKGGKHGAKRIGGLEVDALLAHGAVENLKDAQLIRGAKNEDYWNAVRLGRPIPKPQVPFVYEKFTNLLKASGINVRDEQDKVELSAMTDADVDKLAQHEITAGTTVDSKHFEPMKGGLFDKGATGGLTGKRWGKITLTDPIPNPVMEDPIRRILGLTGKGLQEILTHKTQVNGKSGGLAIQEALANVDVDQAIEKAKDDIQKLRGSQRDGAAKTLRYLTTMKKQNRKLTDMLITKIPVIPPVFRPISKMGSTTLVSDINDLYRDLIETNNTIRDMKHDLDDSDLAEEHAKRYAAVKAVQGWGQSITPEGSAKGLKGAAKQIMGNVAKHGLFQSKVVSKPVEQVGRAVITADGDLDMDTTRLPEDSAWDLFKPYVTRTLVKRGYAPMKVREMIEDRHPEADRVLDEEMSKRPVLINRAPSWHKYSIMAQHAKRSGDNTLHISPLTVAGYNADFDGDNQINKVVLAINHKLYPNLTCNLKNLLYSVESDTIYNKQFWEDRKMAYFNLNVGMYRDYNFYAVDLEEFPYDETVEKGISKKGNATFFGVPEGVKVVAYSEETNKPVLASVSGWSRHINREVWVIDLMNGRQILSDDDERAVYGIDCKTLEYVRRRPAEASDVMVPCVNDMENITDEYLKAIQFDLPAYGAQDGEGSYIFKPTLTMSAKVGYFLGAAVGDGWVQCHKDKPKGYCISGIHTDVIDFVKEAGNELLADTSRPLHWNYKETPDSYGASCTYTWNSVAIAEWLGPYIGKGAVNKHLPAFWMHTPREFRLGMLSGLLDTDGSVTVIHSKKKPQLVANYCSISLRLIRELQLMLKSVGVRSNIGFSKVTQAGNDFWTLTISAVDLYSIKDELVCKKKLIVDSFADEAAIPDKETPAATRSDSIPITPEIAVLLADAERRHGVPIIKKNGNRAKKHTVLYTQAMYGKTKGYISRVAAKRLIASNPDIELPARWLALVQDTSVTWAGVKKVTATGKAEVGYDLTVPGFETFMATDGVILSNTMNYHVPASDEAVKEAYDMMPSKNLFAISDLGSIQHGVSKEQVSGLAALTRAPTKEKPVKFASKAAASAAYHNGMIQLNTPIQIIGK